MQSKPLKQIVAMVIDSRGMEGPITRRALAEEVMRMAGNDKWSVADEYGARLAFLQNEITTQMNEPHSAAFIERHMVDIPEQFRDTLRKIPRFICVSPRGGRAADHVMTLIATREHWEANFALKDHIVQATRISRNESRDIRDLLEATGATCLADLLGSGREAA